MHQKPTRSNVIKENDLLLGDTVSIDQYECQVKGQLPNSWGKEEPHKMYCGGILFVDHASGMVQVFHQISLGASDTIRSKEYYETQAHDMEVKIKHYIGDNGVFKTQPFKYEIPKRNQHISY